MNSRTLWLALAGLFAASGATVLAKDDPAARKAAEEEVRKDYRAKKIYFSADLAYSVDPSKLKDTRWEWQERKPSDDPDQGMMMVMTFPSGNASDTTPSIRVFISKCIQTNTATRKEYSTQFKAIGKSVKVAAVKDMAEGHYLDWMAQATEPSKADCKPTAKKRTGPAEYWGCAVANGPELTDDTIKVRCRRDWYLWTRQERAGTYTWTVQAQTSEKFMKNDDWIAKLDDLIRNLKELEDKRLK